MGKDVMIALDFPSKKDTLNFLDLFTEQKLYVKIGMELFYKEGPQIIEEIKRRGHQVFLDLKLHDIPNTVESAMRSLASLGVDMVNVHAAGGTEMMTAAKRGLGDSDTLLIAVTQLTSMSQERMEQELWIDQPLPEVVKHYAKNTKDAGLDGVVCSPQEAQIIHEHCGEQFLTVTPGIRFEDSVSDDQVRVMTPTRAKEIGSDYIVVGRPITQSENPVAVYERCIKEFVGK